MAPSDDEQQFCLRWNNFQKNITSQFETLRDDEDFVDVTLACEQRTFGAHKVVLSACSPFFKQLFKRNPCTHPIIFMRDVAAKDVEALLEFMYAGEVNVAQANLAGFLRTAESLQIRGLTETTKKQKETTAESIKETTSDDKKRPAPPQTVQEPLKKICKIENDISKTQYDIPESPQYSEKLPELDMIEPKIEPDYESDNGMDKSMDESILEFDGNETGNIFGNVSGTIDSLPGGSTVDLTQDSNQALFDLRKLHSLEPRHCHLCGRQYSNLSNLRQHMRLIHHPQTVKCQYCNKQFKTTLYLKRHLASYHQSLLPGENNNFKDQTTSDASSGSMKSNYVEDFDTFTPEPGIFTCQKENISLQQL